MKRLASALIFVCFNALVCLSAAGFSARVAEAKSDPGQYTLNIHVSASRYWVFNQYNMEVLTATGGNRHYELWGHTSSSALTNPGDYHARLIQDEHKTSYESVQRFEIQFPDGSTRGFDVVAQSE
jgi:hypothetical protein